jgi:1-acyl-sn-glycerol-3-phosphate acyltransferase
MTLPSSGAGERHNGAVARRSKPEKYSPSWFWPLGGIAAPFIRSVARVTTIDDHNLPERGAFVLAPNHYSEIDPLVVAVAVWRLGRKPRFLAKASLFKVPVIGPAFRATGQIPVERDGMSRSSIPLDEAQKLVREQSGIIVYPEGSLTRDPDLWPMRGKVGAVRLALEHDIPLIPAAHWGTQNLMGRYSKGIRMFPRSRIDLVFGEPVDLSAFRGRPIDAALLTEATEVLMQHITALLARLRGEPAPAVRWNPKSQGQTETGRFD